MLPYIYIFGRAIPMYGLCMAVGIVAAFCAACHRVKRLGGNPDSLIVIAACAVGCGLVGAKILYIAVSLGLSEAALALRHGNWQVVFGGGQVFYGGLLGGVLGGFLGARVVRENPAPYCRAIVPCVPLGHAFGRLGCFFAGCCYGLGYEGPGSVRFPAAGVDHAVFPIQLAEMTANLALSLLLMRYTVQNRRPCRELYLYLMCYAVIRFALEFFRGDLIRGAASGLSTSQWISLLLFPAAAALFFLRRESKKDASR